MFQILPMAQQSVTADPAAAMAAGGVVTIAIAIAVAAVFGVVYGLIVGLLLKFVGQAVLGYPVRYGSAFLSIFVGFLVSFVIGLALALGGVIPITPPAGTGLMAQLMPQGMMVFAVGQAVSVIILTWAIRTFLTGPAGCVPLGAAPLFSASS